jgi:hypothetical protein
MATGHDHPDWAGLSSQAIDRLLKNPEVATRLFRLKKLDREYDLPYLGGYSEDGETIYIDRHLPEELTYEHDGQKKTFNPDHFIERHEEFEKAVMDACNWAYGHAHQAANGYERRGVLAAGMLWVPYNEVLKPFIKADEHEKLKKVMATQVHTVAGRHGGQSVPANISSTRTVVRKSKVT